MHILHTALRAFALLLILVTLAALSHVHDELKADVVAAEARTAEASRRATEAQASHEKWAAVRDRYRF